MYKDLQLRIIAICERGIKLGSLPYRRRWQVMIFLNTNARKCVSLMNNIWSYTISCQLNPESNMIYNTPQSTPKSTASYLILLHRTGNMVIATWRADSWSCRETDFVDICTSTIDTPFSRSPTATMLTRNGDPSSIIFEQCSEWSDHKYKQIIDNLWEISRYHPLRKWHSAVRAQL